MLNPGLNTGGAMKFAALASSAYCPDYLNKSSTQTSYCIASSRRYGRLGS